MVAGPYPGSKQMGLMGQQGSAHYCQKRGRRERTRRRLVRLAGALALRQRADALAEAPTEIGAERGRGGLFCCVLSFAGCWLAERCGRAGRLVAAVAAVAMQLASLLLPPFCQSTAPAAGWQPRARQRRPWRGSACSRRRRRRRRRRHHAARRRRCARQQLRRRWRRRRRCAPAAAGGAGSEQQTGAARRATLQRRP